MHKTSSTIPAKGMAELQLHTGLVDSTKIQFTFKPSKVSANCRHKGRNYGGHGPTLQEAISDLINRINTPIAPVQVF